MPEPSTTREPAPRILIVTSSRAPGAAITSVLAALEATGAEIRALDVGKMSERPSWRVWQAVLSELGERRLHQELAENPPDVALAFDPAAVAALAHARDDAIDGAPVVAVVAELEPDASWGETQADRYLAIDDEAAVALADAGVPEHRIIPVGPMGERLYAEAAAEPRQIVREKFKLGNGKIVLVEVGGLGGDAASQIALQLSLLPGKPLILFDAGGDSGAAHTLRAQVPTLEIRAKLFGTTRDAPRLWRAADAIIARPRPRAVSRALVLGAHLVGLSPESEDEEAWLAALERRGIAAAAKTPLLLSSALEPILAKPARTDDRIAADGAEAVADVAWVVARDRDAVLGEIRAARSAEQSARVEAAASAVESQVRRARAAGDLEDLGGGPDVGGARAEPEPESEVDRDEIDELIRQIAKRSERGKKRLIEARQAADSWQDAADRARREGDDDAARDAQNKSDRERARMHEVLAELAELEKEMTRLKRARAAADSAPRAKAPTAARAQAASAKAASSASGGSRSASRSASVDELLDRLKRDQASGARRPASGAGDVDEELEALKRKIDERRRRR